MNPPREPLAPPPDGTDPAHENLGPERAEDNGDADVPASGGDEAERQLDA